MKPVIKVSGIGQVVNALEKLEAVVGKERGESAFRSAEEIRDRIKAKAPVGPTGNLKRSPVARKYGNVAIAGVDRRIAPHAHLVEFGTSHSAAHPFFRPAIAGSKDEVVGNFKEDIGKAIKGAF